MRAKYIIFNSNKRRNPSSRSLCQGLHQVGRVWLREVIWGPLFSQREKVSRERCLQAIGLQRSEYLPPSPLNSSHSSRIRESRPQTQVD